MTKFDHAFAGLNRFDFISTFNSLFLTEQPFFFLINYDQTFFDVIEFDQLTKNGVFLSIAPKFFLPNKKMVPNVSQISNSMPSEIVFKKFPIPFLEYTNQFETVEKEIRNGNTYLLNLTTETPIQTNLSLGEIFTFSGHYGNTPYRLWYRDLFTSFSPETFVTIDNQTIKAFPMKGTYLSQKSAEAACRKMNPKEYWEQTTVVDRVRNDLSLICEKVKVEHFLTVQEVETHHGKIYQTISEVKGKLNKDFFHNPGGNLLNLLPAASITGAPCHHTVLIIKKIENHNRNFYTGIWGLCQERNIVSSVIIRYIEKRGKKLFYKSGGGITFMSEVEKEYQEMIDKVYLPFNYPLS